LLFWHLGIHPSLGFVEPVWQFICMEQSNEQLLYLHGPASAFLSLGLLSALASALAFLRRHCRPS
jgi:hypothetical protein